MFWRYLTSLCWLIAISFLSGASLIVIIQVIFRYAFNFSIAWAEELARFLMVYVGVLGAAFVVKEESHPRIDFFLNYMPKKVNLYINLLFDLLKMLFLVILIKYSWILVFEEGMVSRTIALRIKWAYPYFSIVFSGIVMLLFVLNNFVKKIINLLDQYKLS